MSENKSIEYDPEMTWYQVYCLGRSGAPVTLSEGDGAALVSRLQQSDDGWLECVTVHGCPCHIRLSSVQQIIKSDYETRSFQYAVAEIEKAKWQAKQEEDKSLWREAMKGAADMAAKAAEEMDEGDGWKKKE